MKLHPRYRIVAEARRDADEALWYLIRKHDLTYCEMFSILGDMVMIFAKYAIRLERHPDDPDKKGDEE